MVCTIGRGLLVALTICCASCSTGTDQSGSNEDIVRLRGTKEQVEARRDPEVAGATFELSVEENAILELTNKARKSDDIRPLRPNRVLCQVARLHSRNMARQRKMSHELDGKSSGHRVTAAGYDYSAVGENVAFGNVVLEEIFDGWMKSKGHRENILRGAYEEIGIGVTRDNDGNAYYTQVFGARRTAH